ncbi:uncharacterized protein LOC126372819 isoform X2 [Pectinophora gossypiella]|nr:uncharacterized protein LOC126372819 isoform X2 [Pectinophora gossypiella]XP_049874683.1 uncharacterized protein LOC126372819 isoform X2 [Pectinophora gossypiella]XP_049874685.1 uncharacterized protein LOC126372819 isoform X2 [Pectinophora gossypiella]
MLDIRWTVLAMIALWCARAAAVPTVDVHAVVNHTICPTEFTVDVDPNREPRVIKYLKCAQEDASARCARAGIPRNECCAHRRPGGRLHCVELHDQVTVQYVHAGRPPTSVIYDVAVGCACMLTAVRPAARPAGPQ